MIRNIYTTAASLRALLCYINSGETPDIAYDKDEYARPLIQKVKESLGDRLGSQPASIVFYKGEEELLRQFEGCCYNISGIFKSLGGNFSG